MEGCVERSGKLASLALVGSTDSSAEQVGILLVSSEENPRVPG